MQRASFYWQPPAPNSYSSYRYASSPEIRMVSIRPVTDKVGIDEWCIYGGVLLVRSWRDVVWAWRGVGYMMLWCTCSSCRWCSRAGGTLRAGDASKTVLGSDGVEAGFVFGDGMAGDPALCLASRNQSRIEGPAGCQNALRMGTLWQGRSRSMRSCRRQAQDGVPTARSRAVEGLPERGDPPGSQALGEARYLKGHPPTAEV